MQPHRAATEGAKAYVDPDGYRQWVAKQRANFEEAAKLDREVKTDAKTNN